MNETNDEIALVVLPWAKENMPDAYAQTIGVSNRPLAYRNYLLRLLERRWERDKNGRTELPLRLLELTCIEQRMRLPDGTEIVVRGERCEGEREWTWLEMHQLLQAGRSLQGVAAIKRELALVHVNASSPKRSR